MQQNTTFGQNLATLRKKANLSQDKLAEQLHITRQAISKWESSTSTPDVDTIIKICNILQVSPNELLLGMSDSSSDLSSAPRKHHHDTDIAFVITSVFLIVVFISGIILLLFNFYGDSFEPKITTFSLSLMALSLISYFLIALVKSKSKKK